jgi:hypothetical protein
MPIVTTRAKESSSSSSVSGSTTGTPSPREQRLTLDQAVAINCRDVTAPLEQEIERLKAQLAATHAAIRALPRYRAALKVGDDFEFCRDAVRFDDLLRLLGEVDAQGFLTVGDSDNPMRALNTHGQTGSEAKSADTLGPANMEAVAKNVGAIRQEAERSTVRNLVAAIRALRDDWKAEIAEFATKDDPYYNGVRQCLSDLEATEDLSRLLGDKEQE